MQFQLLQLGFWGCLLLVGTPLWAQTYYPVRQQTDTVTFKVASEKGRLSIALQAPKLASGKLFRDLPQPLELYLEDAHLALDYRAPKLQKGLVYDLRLSLLDASGTIVAAEDWELNDTEAEGRENIRQLQWLDRTENGLYYGGTYTLRMDKLLLSQVDCNAEQPEWSTAQQWPYWVAAAAGGVLVGLGQDQRRKKEDHYSQYLQQWEAGQPQSDAQPFFDEARVHQSRSKWLTAAGWGVLAVDAFLWIRKRSRVKSAQRIFDEYCAAEDRRTLNLVPLRNTQNGQWIAGLQYTTSF